MHLLDHAALHPLDVAVPSVVQCSIITPVLDVTEEGSELPEALRSCVALEHTLVGQLYTLR